MSSWHYASSFVGLRTEYSVGLRTEYSVGLRTHTFECPRGTMYQAYVLAHRGNTSVRVPVLLIGLTLP